MVTTVRAEAVITAQNKLRPGLAASARELEKFRVQQRAASNAFAMGIAKSLAGIGTAYQVMDVARKAFASSVSMEREMYNVQRATDATGAALKKNEDFILDLARATGKTKEELAQMFAAGGFAGRPAHELQRYTEYAAKATLAWGTNAQETGQALAELGNIYDASQKRIEQIGDTINSVADSSASSEKDLIEILRRAGGAGKGIGISAENMLALGAALKEVGVGTEVAATGLNALVTKISTPDDGFDEALVSAGLNAKKFRKAVEKDATGAILILLKALDKAQGTKRLSILKDMFGMEYADDMSRLVGALPRVLKLLDLANDKQKALGSVRAGAALAMEKDFNRLDRATQSIDVMMKRTGDTMKVVAGQFAEFINEAVDSAEKAERRLRRLREIDADTAEREGKMPSPSKGGPTAAEQEDRVLKGIAAGQYDEDTLRYVVTHAPTERARQAAEDEYRRQRYARSDRQKSADEANHWDLYQTYRDSSLNKGGFLNGPARRQSAKELAKAEEIRILRMQREFGDMYRIPTAQAGLDRAQTGLGSLSRLGSFGTLPITLGKGKGAKTYAAPTLDAAGFDGIKAKVDEVTEGVMALGPSLASGLTSGFSTMEAEALAAIARIQQAINNLRPPSLSFGPGGFNTGRQGPN